MKLELIESSKIEGEEIKEKCTPINLSLVRENKDELMKLQILTNEMIKLCQDKGGVGLACPQVGVWQTIFIWKYQNNWEAVINPTIYHIGSPKVQVFEQCLSYPNKKFLVKRPKRVRVLYYTIKEGQLVKKFRELTGRASLIFQHEYDHLEGRTINIIGKGVK